MILSFKNRFVEPILRGTKIHTIREDKHNRWKPGKVIHAATDIRTKKYNQFFSGVCESVQSFEIKYLEVEFKGKKYLMPQIWIDHKYFDFIGDITHKLASNDGFESMTGFLDWFGKDFKGKIIHWTKFKY